MIHAFIVQFGPDHGPDHEAFHIAFDQLRGLCVEKYDSIVKSYDFA